MKITLTIIFISILCGLTYASTFNGTAMIGAIIPVDAVAADKLLLESGDALLLESGDNLLLE